MLISTNLPNDSGDLQNREKKDSIENMIIFLTFALVDTLKSDTLLHRVKIKREIRQRKKTGQGQSGELWEDMSYHRGLGNTARLAYVFCKTKTRVLCYLKRDKESPTCSALNLVSWMRKHTTRFTQTHTDKGTLFLLARFRA